MGSLSERVVRAALQDIVDAGRTPVEAAGEVRFLDEVMIEQKIVSQETAEESRRAIVTWLTEKGLSPEDIQQANEYTRFLHEKVATRPNQMPVTEKAWREWRQVQD